jgi:hypothetical protein
MLKSWPVLLAFMIISSPALADGGDTGDLNSLQKLLGSSGAVPLSEIRPAQTDDALHLTPNKNEIIHLEHDAASVIVNNPDHAQVLLDSPRMLIVMPREPGATSFTVFDADGKILLEKDVIISGAVPRYVRVRRICNGASDCVPTAYYYCPDACYEVTAMQSTGVISGPPPIGNVPRAAAPQPEARPAPVKETAPEKEEALPEAPSGSNQPPALQVTPLETTPIVPGAAAPVLTPEEQKP